MESQSVQKFLCDHKTAVPLLSFKNVLLNFKPFHSISRLKTFIVFKRSIITSNFSILVSNTFSLISSSIVRNVEKKVFYLYQEDMEAPYYVRDILKLSKKTRIRKNNLKKIVLDTSSHTIREIISMKELNQPRVACKLPITVLSNDTLFIGSSWSCRL